MAMNTQHKMGMNGVVKSGGEETMEIFTFGTAVRSMTADFFLSRRYVTLEIY